MATPPVPPGGFNCEETWPLLFEYLDGGLDLTRRSRVEAHLRHCLHCRSASELQQAIHTLADASPEPAPEDLKARLRARLFDDETPDESLSGTWPDYETPAEKVKRLSKFTTRKRDPEAPASNTDITEREAREARIGMGDLAAVIHGTFPEGPTVAPAREPATPRPTLSPEAVAANVAMRQRVNLMYRLGIATILVLVLAVFALSQFRKTADPPPVVPTTLVEALLNCDSTPADLKPVTDPQQAEQVIAGRIARPWPVVLPWFYPDPASAYGGITGAGVMHAADQELGCITFSFDGIDALLFAMPDLTLGTLSGVAQLERRMVEEVPMMATATAGRHLLFWETTVEGHAMLYGLVVLGSGRTPGEVNGVALNTYLGVEQRIREREHRVP